MRYSSKKRRTHGPSKPVSVMSHLLSGVAREAPGGFLQQSGGHAEIDLSAREVSMAQVDRELGEQLLDVGPLPVPGRQTMDGKAVTQVVQSRLIPRAVRPPEASRLAQA